MIFSKGLTKFASAATAGPGQTQSGSLADQLREASEKLKKVSVHQAVKNTSAPTGTTPLAGLAQIMNFHLNKDKKKRKRQDTDITTPSSSDSDPDDD